MIDDIAASVLRLLDAETAHRATIAALRLSPASAPPPCGPLATRVFGLDFPNPLGLAAGFDKNAEAFAAVPRLGFGFVEVGTLTPRPQPGNAKPRVFRLLEDRAVVNRYGFNNDGHAPALARLSRRAKGAIVGVNVGANKDAEDRGADYAAGVKTFAKVADYLTINVSSPNTPGLRDLQEPAALKELLARALDARASAREAPPLLLKIAPDVSLEQLDGIVRVARDAKIDGMIVSNTTIARPDTLRSPLARESGGLSGAPLFDLSTRRLAQTYMRVEGQFPLVGVGGIDGPDTAFAKLEAGAGLLQLYSALVFEGPGLAKRIVAELTGRLAREGAELGKIVGRRAREVASAE